ncbi:hypothetical protein H072_7298 [Dactylellina haptotyla CBS 200.50]|uniref:glucan endo-1,3-beta-D-glucosidase n=1 Tax=Dactylellina haptotyla (strain CBS 200.50) TaxID=1284197 RepID=S8A7X5_DACHA|nr:hypothetical protein H072_7298 [Dactylellina haptotyla CBS 200.50]
MLLSKIISFGLQALLFHSFGGNAVPIPDIPDDSPAAPFDPKIYKGAPFNPEIPVPVVAPPPVSNSTIVARDGSIVSSPHDLSNPEIRARATVYRPSVGYFAGFNMGTYTKTGACKSLDDWRSEMRKVKSFNNQHFKFTVIKIFTTAQCSALANALQAAQEIGGIKIWAGIWSTPYATFQSDKNELGRQIVGNKGYLIAGVSVGSEEMYRGMAAGTLSGYIWDVKGMIQNAYGKTNIPVGTSDGIAPFLNGANQAVLDASDVVMVTDYPYYGGVRVEQALRAFQQDWWNLAARMNGKAIVVGETGWPTLGNTIGQAVPTIAKAGQYFKAVACWMRSTKKPFFWFEAVDEQWKPGGTAETRFGVSWYGGDKKFGLTC